MRLRQQQMTQQLRVLEDLTEGARKLPAPTVDMLVERAKTINEAHRRERKHLYAHSSCLLPQQHALLPVPLRAGHQ